MKSGVGWAEASYYKLNPSHVKATGKSRVFRKQKGCLLTRLCSESDTSQAESVSHLLWAQTHVQCALLAGCGETVSISRAPPFSAPSWIGKRNSLFAARKTWHPVNIQKMSSIKTSRSIDLISSKIPRVKHALSNALPTSHKPHFAEIIFCRSRDVGLLVASGRIDSWFGFEILESTSDYLDYLGFMSYRNMCTIRAHS